MPVMVIMNTSSIFMPSPNRRRNGRRITRIEARHIALRAMELTDRLLTEDKERDADYFRKLANADDLDDFARKGLRESK